MKKLYPTPKQGVDGSPLAEYVRRAFYWAHDFKQDTQMRILHTDGYFAHKANIPELTVDFCDDKDEDCKKKKLHVSLDAIGQKVDAFVAVATDAIIQVEKPWVISPTIRPELPAGYRQQIANAIIDVIGNLAAQMSGGDEAVYYGILINMLEDRNNAYDFIRDQRDAIYALIEEEVNQRARETAKTLDYLVYDDVQESNWVDQADSFLHSFGKYDFAVIKTPEWVLGYEEKVRAQQIKEVQGTFLKHENIHPKNYFCSEDSTWEKPGTFEMDISTISMNELISSKEFDGFLPKEIDRVCEFFADTNRDWLVDNYRPRSNSDKWRGYEHIAIIKYHGKVDCGVLMEYLSAKDKKQLKAFAEQPSYECTIWVIHEFVVYLDISLSKITRRPYKVGTYTKRGEHKYDGRGIWSLCIEFQAIIDKFATMMIENANLAAGAIIGYNRNKIAAESFHPSDIRGGARIPVKSSITDGGNDRPIFEIRFESHVSEFFGIITQMEAKMDERSQIPSFSVGFTSKISSVRSTGIASINQQNVNKAVVRKLLQFEKHVVKPMVKELVSYHLWNTKDSRILEGATDVQVQGYSEIIRKQDKQQNLDLVMQNAIGLQNAINQMQAQGQDVAGLIALFKRYIDMSGFDAEKFFSNGQVDIAAGLAQVGSDAPPLDGRSGPQVEAGVF